MDENRLLNIKEASHFLGIPEKELKALVAKGKLTAYQIGGMYLRFKLEQLQGFKHEEARHTQHKPSTLSDGVKDFFYFNNFYILAALIMAVLLFIILRNIS